MAPNGLSFLILLPELLSNTMLTISVGMQATFCLWSMPISTSEGRMLQPKPWADWETGHSHSGPAGEGVMLSRNPKTIRHLCPSLCIISLSKAPSL